MFMWCYVVVALCRWRDNTARKTSGPWMTWWPILRPNKPSMVKLSPLQPLAGLDCGICRPRTCPRGRPEIQNSRRGDETRWSMMCKDFLMFFSRFATSFVEAAGRSKHSRFVHWRCQVGISVLLPFGRQLCVSHGNMETLETLETLPPQEINWLTSFGTKKVKESTMQWYIMIL